MPELAEHAIRDVRDYRRHQPHREHDDEHQRQERATVVMIVWWLIGAESICRMHAKRAACGNGTRE
jgi:hypothetical protein